MARCECPCGCRAEATGKAHMNDWHSCAACEETVLGCGPAAARIMTLGLVVYAVACFMGGGIVYAIANREDPLARLPEKDPEGPSRWP